jgi:hypothetical protein
MKKRNKISKTIYRILVAMIMLSSQVSHTLAQEPSFYPDENEPIPPTVVNILIYIGGPLLLFVIYYYYRKWEKKKASSSGKPTEVRKAKAPSSAKATEGKED